MEGQVSLCYFLTNSGRAAVTELTLSVEGEDENEAFDAVCAVINAGFYELDED